jgi:hypothetical protein
VIRPRLRADRETFAAAWLSRDRSSTVAKAAAPWLFGIARNVLAARSATRSGVAAPADKRPISAVRHDRRVAIRERRASAGVELGRRLVGSAGVEFKRATRDRERDLTGGRIRRGRHFAISVRADRARAVSRSLP